MQDLKWMKPLYFRDNLKLFLSYFALLFLGLKNPQTPKPVRWACKLIFPVNFTAGGRVQCLQCPLSSNLADSTDTPSFGGH